MSKHFHTRLLSEREVTRLARQQKLERERIARECQALLKLQHTFDRKAGRVAS